MTSSPPRLLGVSLLSLALCLGLGPSPARAQEDGSAPGSRADRAEARPKAPSRPTGRGGPPAGAGGTATFLTTRWSSVDGAQPQGGRGESSTLERSLGAGVSWRTRDGARVGLTAAVDDRADAGLTPLPGSTRRLGGLRAVSLGGFYSKRGRRGRRTLGGLSIRGSAEDPSDLTDALGAVLWVGRDRPTSDRTRFGWGLVALFRTGEGLRIFPAPTFQWKPTERWTLNVAGPRSEVRYDLSPRWQLALSAQVALRRYRMADGTLFVDRQLPVRLGLRRMIRRQVAFEVFAGRLMNRSWEVQDRAGGAPDLRLDVDGGTLVGFQASVPLGRR